MKHSTRAPLLLMVLLIALIASGPRWAFADTKEKITVWGWGEAAMAIEAITKQCGGNLIMSDFFEENG